MNDSTGSHDGPSFHIEPKSKFFGAIREMVEFEIRPGNTVSFIHEVDLTGIERLRSRRSGGRKPSYTAFVAKAVALALRDYPYANRRVCRPPSLLWSRRRLQTFHHCDVAVAIERDFPGGESATFIDILRAADRLSLAEIGDALYALSVSDMTTNKQWREFSTIITRLPQWLSTLLIRLPCILPGQWVKYRGGAVLISSPAKYGVDIVAATWTHPVGISFGLVRPRPVVREAEIVACPTFALTLNFDRRVMAGAQAARFFKRMIDVLEHAETEMAPYLSPLEDAPSEATPHGEVSPTSVGP